MVSVTARRVWNVSYLFVCLLFCLVGLSIAKPAAAQYTVGGYANTTVVPGGSVGSVDGDGKAYAFAKIESTDYFGGPATVNDSWISIRLFGDTNAQTGGIAGVTIADLFDPAVATTAIAVYGPAPDPGQHSFTDTVTLRFTLHAHADAASVWTGGEAHAHSWIKAFGQTLTADADEYGTSDNTTFLISQSHPHNTLDIDNDYTLTFNRVSVPGGTDYSVAYVTYCAKSWIAASCIDPTTNGSLLPSGAGAETYIDVTVVP